MAKHSWKKEKRVLILTRACDEPKQGLLVGFLREGCIAALYLLSRERDRVHHRLAARISLQNNCWMVDAISEDAEGYSPVIGAGDPRERTVAAIGMNPMHFPFSM